MNNIIIQNLLFINSLTISQNQLEDVVQNPWNITRIIPGLDVRGIVRQN